MLQFLSHPLTPLQPNPNGLLLSTRSHSTCLCPHRYCWTPSTTRLALSCCIQASASSQFLWVDTCFAFALGHLLTFCFWSDIGTCDAIRHAQLRMDTRGGEVSPMANGMDSNHALLPSTRSAAVLQDRYRIVTTTDLQPVLRLQWKTGSNSPVRSHERRARRRGMTLGDPRGAGELAGTATGYAFVVHGFACLVCCSEAC